MIKLAVTYTILALIATATNIASQAISVRLYSGIYSITLSIFVGTLTGLLLKYILDKEYIFKFKANSAAHDTRTFLLYCVMGIATTTIFWGFEYAFQFFFGTEHMRYLGGMIGLAIGYITKYQLDKRFVFKQGNY
jgi:hypothetical protein